MTGSPYRELRVPVTEDTSEGVTNFLWELGALGVVEESEPSGPAMLRAFFSTDVGDALDASVREYMGGLERLGFRIAGSPTVLPLVDENWATAWREHFRPLAIGASLLVAPSWNIPAAEGRVLVVIDPGRAFGTGQHGTTRGCLEALEGCASALRATRAIDIGTGSGILAIALARLGISHVLAVDDDPDAIAAARANAETNGVTARVECLLADAASLDAPPSTLLVANLLTAAHRRLGTIYARHVIEGGRLVLGGILEAETDEVVAAMRVHGLELVQVRTIDGWTTLVLARP